MDGRANAGRSYRAGQVEVPARLTTEDGGRDIDDPATTFAELLSCLRLAARLSQNTLARAAGVNASYVNRLESGERTTPTREVVVALARALEATPTERDQLLWLAGQLPVRLQQLSVSDPTLSAVLQVLTDKALPPSVHHAFRQGIEALAGLSTRCWMPSSGRSHTPACRRSLAGAAGSGGWTAAPAQTSRRHDVTAQPGGTS